MKENLLKHRPTKTRNNEIESVYENGIIIIIYPKKFGSIEKWVKDRIGGPDQVRRPLDKFTTFIWENCNGENNIAEIIRVLNKLNMVLINSCLWCNFICIDTAFRFRC